MEATDVGAEEKFPSPNTGQESELKPRGILDAVEIAVARSELEEALFHIPVTMHEEWPQKYEDIMTSHPSLAPYRNIFDRGLYTAENDYKYVSDAWKNIYHFEREPSPQEIPSTATGEISDRFCRLYTNFRPNDPTTLIRGSVTMRIVLSDRDYKRYRRENKWKSKALAQFGVISDRVPLIAMPESSNLDPTESDSTVTHELQHALNEITRSTYHLVDTFPLTDYSQEKRIGSLISDKYYSFKNEFLAYISMLPFSGDTDQMRQEFRDVIANMLEGNLIKDSKWREEVKNGKGKQLIEYSSIAFTDLINILFDTNPEINNFRVAVNFLSQFPVERWPAAVRLLKSRKNDIEDILTNNQLIKGTASQEQSS